MPWPSQSNVPVRVSTSFACTCTVTTLLNSSVLRSVLFEVEKQHGIGARDFRDFAQRRLLHFGGAGESVFLHELVDDSDRENVVAALGQRDGSRW